MKVLILFTPYEDGPIRGEYTLAENSVIEYSREYSDINSTIGKILSHQVVDDKHQLVCEIEDNLLDYINDSRLRKLFKENMSLLDLINICDNDLTICSNLAGCGRTIEGFKLVLAERPMVEVEVLLK